MGGFDTTFRAWYDADTVKAWIVQGWDPGDTATVRVGVDKRNLVITPPKISSNGDITYGYSVTGPGSIYYPGWVEAELYYVDAAGKYLTRIDAHHDLKSAPGDKETFTVKAANAPTQPFNAVGIVAIIDKDDQVFETDQGDNRAFVPLTTPDIRVERLYREARTVKCSYRIGAIPWYVNGNNISIGLYYATGPTRRDIIPNQPAAATKSLTYEGPDSANKAETLQFSTADFTLAPYKGQYLVAVFDIENRIPQITRDNDEKSIEWPFLDQIPQIQDRLKLPRGATLEKASKLQRDWLNGPAAVSKSKPGMNAVFSENLPYAEKRTIMPGGGTLGYDTSFTMEWVLDSKNSWDNRVRSFVDFRNQDKADKVKFPNLMQKPAARTEMINVLTRLFERRPQKVGETIKFGNLSVIGSELYKQATQRQSIKDSTILDPVTHALGGFTIFAVPCGEVTVTSTGKVEVTITHFGVFLADVFEFNQTFQALGSWSVDPADVSSYNYFYTQVSNSSYRNYRNEIGRGRDIVIMSPAMRRTLTVPIKMKLRVRNAGKNLRAKTGKNISKRINVMETGQDVNNPVGIDAVEQPANGVVTLDSASTFARSTGAQNKTSFSVPDTTLTYMPNSDFVGEDTFYYSLVDAEGATETHTITVSVLPPPPPPAPVTIQEVQATKVRFGWSNVSGAIAYGLEESSDGSTWKVRKTVPYGQSASVTVDVNQRRRYFYRVFSIGEFGRGEAGAILAVDTPSGMPDAPGSLLLLSARWNGADITWLDVPLSESGFYEIHASTDGGNTFSLLRKVPRVHDVLVSVSLRSLTSYRLRIYAVDQGIKSRTSNTVQFATPGEPPPAPQGLFVKGKTPRTVTLGWLEMSGISPDDEYRVLISKDGDTFRIAEDVGVGHAYQAIIDTESGTQYWFAVKAIKNGVAGPISNVVSTTTPTGLPDAPQNLQVLEIGAYSVKIRWQAVPGLTNAEYIVQYSLDGVSWRESEAVGLNSNETAVIDVLPSRHYWARVRARDVTYGMGPASNVVELDTESDAVTGLRVTGVRSTGADLAWKPMPAALSYRVQVSPDGVSSWRLQENVPAGSNSKCTVSLTAGKTFYFRVLAILEAGPTSPSNVVFVITPRSQSAVKKSTNSS